MHASVLGYRIMNVAKKKSCMHKGSLISSWLWNEKNAVCKKMQYHEGIIRIKWNLMHKQFVLVQINDKVFKARRKKKIKCPKLVFGVEPPNIAISATVRCDMEWNRFWMSAYEREFYIACMHSQSSSYDTARCGSHANTDQPIPTCAQ